MGPHLRHPAATTGTRQGPGGRGGFLRTETTGTPVASPREGCSRRPDIARPLATRERVSARWLSPAHAWPRARVGPTASSWSEVSNAPRSRWSRRSARPSPRSRFAAANAWTAVTSCCGSIRPWRAPTWRAPRPSSRGPAPRIAWPRSSSRGSRSCARRGSPRPRPWSARSSAAMRPRRACEPPRPGSQPPRSDFATSSSWRRVRA